MGEHVNPVGSGALRSTTSALRDEAGSHPSPSRLPMERSITQDIQEGSRELKEAAEQTRNIILDLDLDGVIRWVSPSWTDVVGTHLDAIKEQPISRFIVDEPDVFVNAIESLKHDDSKSQYVKFSIQVGPSSDLGPMLSPEQKEEAERDRSILELDGQGIMVYDRTSGGESHVSSQVYAHWSLLTLPIL